MIPSSKIERSSRHLVRCVAECRTCDWHKGHYLKAARAATKHVRDTGHEVDVERTEVYTVRQEKP